MAWLTAEALWEDSTLGAKIRRDSIDGLTTVIGKGLIVAVPEILRHNDQPFQGFLR
jgi:hypothetical protein